MRGARIVLLTGLLALPMSCAGPAPTAQVTSTTPSASPQADSGPSAKPVTPEPRVGAVFLGNQSLHTCSGAVLDSPSGNLILTAAHCMAAGIDTYFVPQFANEAADSDYFHVDAVYLDPRWVSNQDPRVDFAVARVSRDGGGSVETRAGGGFTVGPAPKAGTDVTVTGYPMGTGGDPVGCTTRTSSEDRGFPALPCAGLVDGTSGAPWVTGSVVAGLIGGLEGGGCEENVSYSPPFDDALGRLLARAEAGGPADDAPTVFDDDC
ncbi:serine protease [Mycolicibacterium sp. P9-64]|uniref:trypsin-like serine peptidase n=1 Tax=Mycolicibacterium sp. P9-64 TaxID=2024612 RepID=UPI0011ED28C1|nr:trypsin-like peptidase domain-containing protein [Mycolicibacterium sp. P9-64]KAA0084681.1 serine protease [Mycolicibacterium sp. P9-64]